MSITVTAALVAIAAPSRTRRRARSNGLAADIAAAARSGTTVAWAGSWSTARSAPELDELLRIERPEPLVRLDGERQQQRGDRRLDHHVGEGQGLDHGVDGG